jgi:hypothetical protein
MKSTWTQPWRLAVTLLALLSFLLVLARFDPSFHQPPPDPIRTLLERR